MIDYKKSGVDIQAGDQLVEWLQGPLVKSTASSDLLDDQLTQIKINSDVPDYKKRVVSGIGGFAALFDGRFSQMKKPLLRLGRLKAVSAFSPKYSPAGWGPCINKSTTKPYVPRSPRFCLLVK